MKPISTMSKSVDLEIAAARAVLPCEDLPPMIDFLVEDLGFQLVRISPADDPRMAQFTGHGLDIEVRRGLHSAPGVLQLTYRGVAKPMDALVAPNGTRVEFVPLDRPQAIPPLAPELVINRAGDSSSWGLGRAGMHYRDLIPSRLGGRFIASHIRILKGGPVPDHVHFHAIRFQMIYCVRGWVRLLYEDQGPDFILNEGDCVLQPPLIRHRVLESSDGLEVVEIACPAEHDTYLDHDMELPTSTVDAGRDFEGQVFTRHQAKASHWESGAMTGMRHRDLGMHRATRGLARALVLRPDSEATPIPWSHDGEFLFGFLVAGSCAFVSAGETDQRLEAGDSVVVPAGDECALKDFSPEFELLEIRL